MHEEWDFFKYYIGMLPQFAFKLNWLWFLPALFIDSVISYPLLKWTQRRHAGKPFNFKEDGTLILGQLFMVSLLVGFQQAAVGNEKTGRKDIMVISLLTIVAYATYFFLPCLLVN